MSKVEVWKYKLEKFGVKESLIVKRPAIVVSVESQGNDIILYTLVNPEEKHVVKVDVLVVRTDELFDWFLTMKFIGTVKLDGSCVNNGSWHVFKYNE